MEVSLGMRVGEAGSEGLLTWEVSPFSPEMSEAGGTWLFMSLWALKCYFSTEIGILKSFSVGRGEQKYIPQPR